MQRSTEIDVLKVAGIATVVLIHSVRSPWDPLVSPLEVWLGHVTRFGVPAFLLCSGFLYATREPVPARITLGRLRRIVAPYLVASLLAQAWRVYRGAGAETGSIAFDLLLGASLGPFYYVFVIAGLVAVTPVFAHLPRRAIGVLALASIAAQWYADAATGLPAPLFWHLRNPILWWAYFLIGWVARPHYDAAVAHAAPRRRMLAVALGSLVVVLAIVCASEAPRLAVRTAAWLEVYAVLALLATLARCVRRPPDWLGSLSDATYGVYLLHLFFVLPMAAALPLPPLHVELLPIAARWTAGMLGPLLIIAGARRALGRASRDVVGG